MSNQNATAAAIEFALKTDDGLIFLRLWNEGEFNKIRDEWPEAPEVVYIGAYPLHPKTTMPGEVDLADAVAEHLHAGQPVYVTAPLDDVQGRLHVAMVNRLRHETGKPVHVIYN